MTRAELVEHRNQLQRVVEERKRLGDYDTNAKAIRMALESNLKLAEHLLSRMKGDS